MKWLDKLIGKQDEQDEQDDKEYFNDLMVKLKDTPAFIRFKEQLMVDITDGIFHLENNIMDRVYKSIQLNNMELAKNHAVKPEPRNKRKKK